MDLLQEAKSRLKASFGPRLHDVILFGSRARGTSTADSDIDLLLLLDRVDYWDDLGAAVDAVYPLMLANDVQIHVIPADASDVRRGEIGLYRNALREGVTL